MKNRTPDSSTAEVQAHLDRLRGMIAGRRHWVLAARDPLTVSALHNLVALLVFDGAGDADVLLMEPRLLFTRSAERVELCVLAVAKRVLPADLLARVLAVRSGTDPRAVLAALEAGRDVVPLGTGAADAEAIAACLDRIARGAAVPCDPAAN